MALSRILSPSELDNIRPARPTEFGAEEHVVSGVSDDNGTRLTEHARKLLAEALSGAEPVTPLDLRTGGRAPTVNHEPRPFHPESFDPPSLSAAPGSTQSATDTQSAPAVHETDFDIPEPRPAGAPAPLKASDFAPTATPEAPTAVATSGEPALAGLPTADALDRVHEEAREEGHRLGYEEGLAAGREAGHREGHSQGLEQAREEQAESIGLLREMLDRLHQRIDEQDQTIEQELVELAITVASRVLRAELHTHPDHVLNAVRAGLARLPSQQTHARIYLHPDDLAAIGGQLRPDDPDQRWTLLEDAGLSRGSHRLEAGSARLTVDMEQRLDDAIDDALNGTVNPDAHRRGEA
ncbi:MAG: FliH/SctL family protein [Gammaproteobacteria bacterium]